ncbi:hypothetical protein, partial [Donghicola mangrovi]|uniref:hypothetical protein n=1 Tax=Donghicola mangrovi TaxID=2729614 RepID=UPI001D158DAA
FSFFGARYHTLAGSLAGKEALKRFGFAPRTIMDHGSWIMDHGSCEPRALFCYLLKPLKRLIATGLRGWAP